jgi:hypothetical protein
MNDVNITGEIIPIIRNTKIEIPNLDAKKNEILIEMLKKLPDNTINNFQQDTTGVL